MPHCIALIDELAEAVPEQMPVFVLCDRGLQSRALFEAICGATWHPVMRLVRSGYWREAGSVTWHRLSKLLEAPGRYYLGAGELFKTDPFPCTLVALWEAGYDAPWLLMTDLAPERCRGSFYGLRAWIEQGLECDERLRLWRILHPPVRAPACCRACTRRAHLAGLGRVASVDARPLRRAGVCRGAVWSLGAVSAGRAQGLGGASFRVDPLVGSSASRRGAATSGVAICQTPPGGPA